MLYANHLLNKLRYGGIRRLTLDALARAGIKIFFYYRILERTDDDTRVSIPSDFQDYEFGFLGENDMAEMAAIPMRSSSESETELRQRLSDGMKCMGAKRAGRIVSYAWYRLDCINLMGDFIPLKPDQAYMFDVFTVMDYRGKGLASCVGHKLYEAVRQEGCTELHSITNIFNTSYLRAKKKLNAVISEKGLFIILFGKIRHHMNLKTYSN